MSDQQNNQQSQLKILPKLKLRSLGATLATTLGLISVLTSLAPSLARSQALAANPAEASIGASAENSREVSRENRRYRDPRPLTAAERGERAARPLPLEAALQAASQNQAASENHLIQSEREALAALEQLQQPGEGVAVNTYRVNSNEQAAIVGDSIAGAINEALGTHPGSQIQVIIPGLSSPAAAREMIAKRELEPGQGRDIKAGLVRFTMGATSSMIGLVILPNIEFFSNLLHTAVTQQVILGVPTEIWTTLQTSLLPMAGLGTLSGLMSWDFTRFMGLVEQGGSYFSRLYQSIIQNTLMPLSRLAFSKGSNGELYTQLITRDGSIMAGIATMWGIIEAFCYGTATVLQHVSGRMVESGSASITKLEIVVLATTWFQGVSEVMLKRIMNASAARMLNLEGLSESEKHEASERVLRLRNKLTIGLSMMAVSLGMAYEADVAFAMPMMLGAGFVANSAYLARYIRNTRQFVAAARAVIHNRVCNDLMTNARAVNPVTL